MPFFIMLAAAALQPPAAPAPVQWGWLNIPDAQGAGARFSFDTAVRRNGQAPGRQVEARIALDCAARTSRLLERQPPDQARPVSSAAVAVPAGLTTREGVLLHVLCLAPPAGNR